MRVASKSAVASAAPDRVSIGRPAAAPFSSFLAIASASSDGIRATDPSSSRTGAQPGTAPRKQDSTEEKKAGKIAGQTPGESTNVAASVPNSQYDPDKSNAPALAACPAETKNSSFVDGQSGTQTTNTTDAATMPAAACEPVPSGHESAESGAPQETTAGKAALCDQPSPAGRAKLTELIALPAVDPGIENSAPGKTDTESRDLDATRPGDGTKDETGTASETKAAKQVGSQLQAVVSGQLQACDDLRQLVGKPGGSKSTGSGNPVADGSKSDRKASPAGQADLVTHGAEASKNADRDVQTATQPAPPAGTSASALSAVAAASQVGGSKGLSQKASVPSAEMPVHQKGDPAGSASDATDREGPEALTAINASRVIQNVNESEMRVGMRSSEFGDISIRTAITSLQMTTQISVDHRDLGTAISAHVPSLAAKLDSEYGIHASIEVNQSASSFSADREQPQRDQQRQADRGTAMPPAGQDLEVDRSIPQIWPTTVDQYRLDIRV